MKGWKTTAVLLFVLSMVGSTDAHAAMSLVDEGKENFTARRFYAAEDCFNRALQADPQNQLIRYLLGQTLEQLYDNKAAKAAYTDCFRINPFNDQGMAAKKALVQLSGRIEEKAHEATDKPETMLKTLDMIQGQAAELQRNYIMRGRGQAAWALEQGNRAAAQRGYYSRMTMRGLRNGRGLYDYNEYYEMSHTGQIASAWYRADAQAQGLGHIAQTTQAAREIANSAANLQILLAAPKRADEPKLRALGTNLYVRNYGTDDHADPTPPEDPPIELKATELKLASLPAIKLGSPAVKSSSAAKISRSSEVNAPISLAQTLGAAFSSSQPTEHEGRTFGLAQILGDSIRSNGTTVQDSNDPTIQEIGEQESLSEILGAALRASN